MAEQYMDNFFTDFQRLYINSPKANLITAYQNENTKFADMVYGAKNGYLSFSF
jgi:hypothetical protein